MKLVLLLLFILPTVFVGRSQILTILNEDTGEPIEGVIIASAVPYAFTVSNALGQTDISEFQGSNAIAFRNYEYKTVIYSFSELQQKGFKISMIHAGIKLNDIIVSATRSRQTTNEDPSRITAISSKEIRLQNPQTAADLLNVSGQVYIQKSQQGGGSPMIRGFATNRLLYVVDGVRMNTAIFRSGNIQNVISLDPFSIENTEILFGPGSVMYGSDAIGGVMSFQTLEPQLSYEDNMLVKGQSIARYSSANNEMTGHLDVNLGWKKFAMTTSISYSDYDDLRMGRIGPEEYLRPYYVERIDGVDSIIHNKEPHIQNPTGFSQLNLMQKLRLRPNEKWDFQYGFHYSTTSEYGRYDRHLRKKDGLPRYAEWNYGPQLWMMNNLKMEHHDRNGLYDRLTIRLTHQLFKESRISRNFNSDLRETREENVQAYAANFDFIKRTGARNELFYGVEMIYDDVKSTGINENISTGSITEGPARYPNSNWSSYGIYITDKFDITEKFFLQSGLRYNQVLLNANFDTTFYPFPFTGAKLNNGALTGSIGFIFRPNAKWVISSNLATAFRSPNVDDIGKVFDSEPGAVVVPNPNLKSEYAYNVDLGLAKIFGESVKADLSVYYTYLDNALVRRDFTLNGVDSIIYEGEMSKVQAIQNIASAYVYGIQAGIELNLKLGFGFSGNLNYQVGEEELDDGSFGPARHVAPLFGNFKLFYERKKLLVQIAVFFNGERSYSELAEAERVKDFIYAADVDGNPYSPAWYSLNFKASYQFGKRVFASAGIENITDQLYRTYSSGIAAPGRNFIFALRYKL